MIRQFSRASPPRHRRRRHLQYDGAAAVAAFVGSGRDAILVLKRLFRVAVVDDNVRVSGHTVGLEWSWEKDFSS